MPTTTELLTFEETWAGRRHNGAKEEAIRATLGIPPARYYQQLGRIIDTLEAEQSHPLLVHRLRRQRETRRAVIARRVT